MYYFYNIVILLILLSIAAGRLPYVKIDRTVIALIGALFLIVSQAISFDVALQSINLNILVLLFSMMIINVNFKFSGLFDLISYTIIRVSKTPKRLLFFLIFIPGMLSAFFLNDIIVLMFVPLVLDVTYITKRTPIPYLLALGISANIGSAMSPIGNPQNMLIAATSKLGFLNFFIPLFPVVLISLLLTWLVIVLSYRSEFKYKRLITLSYKEVSIYKPLLIKNIISVSILMLLFLLNVNISEAALLAASFLLIAKGRELENVFKEINISLLLFFASLFIIVKSLVIINPSLINASSILALFKNPYLYVLFSSILSNIISNVPAVMLLENIHILNSHINIWILLAMSSTFAGNLTIMGSIANLIIAEVSKNKGVDITFFEFFKVGFPIAVFSLVIGTAYLLFIM